MKKTTELSIKEIFNYVTEKGLENTSIRNICNDLDYSIGCLYYRFKSKENMVISIGIYGFNKAVDELFSYAVSTISEPKIFFESFLEFVGTMQDELKIICQIATSPIYGNTLRKSINTQDACYEKYIQRLANVLRISKEEFIPILYMTISVMLDYVILGNYKIAKMQMNILYELMLKRNLIK